MADDECAAAGCKKLAEKAHAFFDKLSTCFGRCCFVLKETPTFYKKFIVNDKVLCYDILDILDVL